jgi:GT2 family glycosyltransferase
MIIFMLNSIIIPVFGNENLLQNLLNTLLPTIDKQCEVIIVDDGYPDMKINIHKLSSEIIYLSNNKNLGYSGSVNVGIRKARGKYITTINSDILLDSNWLKETRNIFEYRKDIGLVGAKLIYPDTGRIQNMGVKYGKNMYIAINKMRKANDPAVNYEMEVESISDALSTMPRQLVIDINGYDEAFYNSYDDLDLCLRIKERGYKILYVPQIIGYHITSASADYRYIKEEECASLFFKKWNNHLRYEEKEYFDYILREFQSRGHSLPKEAYVVDICRKAPLHIVKIFKDISSINIIQSYNYRDYLMNSPLYQQKINIELLYILPFSHLKLKSPIIYIVDSFYFLQDNYYWAKNRENQNDAVFDKGFNLFSLNEVTS